MLLNSWKVIFFVVIYNMIIERLFNNFGISGVISFNVIKVE